MKISSSSLLALIVAAVLLGIATARLGEDATGDFTHPKLIRSLQSNLQKPNYIVVLKPGVGDVRVAARAILDRNDGPGIQPSFVYKRVLKGFSVEELPDQVLKKMLDDVEVEYIEQDGEIIEAGTQIFAPWNLDRLDQIDLPLNATYRYNYNGTGVNVYIADTGLRLTHEQFGGRASCGAWFVSDEPDCIIPSGSDENFYGDPSKCCNDILGHGTHVAGTACGSEHGVAKNCNIISVKATSKNQGSVMTIIKAIDWVTDQHKSTEGARSVLNLSVGGNFSQSLNNAVNDATDDGIVVVVAATNGRGADACTRSPASAEKAITVGMSRNADEIAPVSSIGPCVDIFAPGAGIFSTCYTNDTAVCLNGGTSMAAALVSGLAALYLEASPTNSTPEEVKNAILEDATPSVITGDLTNTTNLLACSARLPVPPLSLSSSADGDPKMSFLELIRLILLELVP